MYTDGDFVDSQGCEKDAGEMLERFAKATVETMQGIVLINKQITEMPLDLR